MSRETSEFRRNFKLLEEVEASTEFRISFKNSKGEWVRLLIPDMEQMILQYSARQVIRKRLVKLAPAVFAQTVDKVIRDLADELQA